MKDHGDHYQEEYVYLADVTHDAALIAWGAFFFDRKMRLVKDKDVHMFDNQFERRTTIGWTAETYGQMTVEVRDAANAVVASVNTPNTYTWVTGLQPDTDYSYRVLLPQPGAAPREWGSGELYRYDKKAKELINTHERYDLRFRTFPDLANPLGAGGLTFAVIGDTGTGEEAQGDVAIAFANAIAARNVRFVLTVGDTVYRGSGGSGDDDFEWLTTYFQPYRTIIDHIPFYPCMGNHDTNENFFAFEKQQDRLTLYDNLLVPQRFRNFAGYGITGREGSIAPGLFYRFQYGRDVEVICLDTSKEKAVFDDRLIEYAHHATWTRAALTAPLDQAALRIPFMHHPPYCKGPKHEDDPSVQKHVVAVCEANGVKAMLAGHEHNFQCIDSPSRQMRSFLTGGGGGWRTGKLKKGTDGWMQHWGGRESGHFLIVTVASDLTAHVEPIQSNGQPLPLFNAGGQATPGVTRIALAP